MRLAPDEHAPVHACREGGFRSHVSRAAAALGRTTLQVRNNTVARHLSGLRQKLRDDTLCPRYIETVAGIGYRMLAPMQERERTA